MIDIKGKQVNPDDYELVNIKAIEKQVREWWVQYENDAPYLTEKINKQLEISRWYGLIRKHTAFADHGGEQ